MKNILMGLMVLSLASCASVPQYVVHDNYRNRPYPQYTKTRNVELDEQLQLLEHYESKSYLYGRQAQDLQSQTRAKIRKLQEN